MVGNFRLGWSPNSALAGAVEREIASDEQRRWLKSSSEWERSILLENVSSVSAGKFSLMHEALHDEVATWPRFLEWQNRHWNASEI